MRPAEEERIAAAVGSAVTGARVLAGGFSHETCLVTLAGGRAVVRLGGRDPGIEAAVMAAGRRYVPVPRVLAVLPEDAGAGARAAMVLEYVTGTPLSEVLATGGYAPAELRGLGAEMGRVAAGIGAERFARPGFFTDVRLTVSREEPWSRQLPAVAEACMAATPDARLDAATRTAWVALCTAHAPRLTAVDRYARLVHSDLNPKNILVSPTPRGWRVDAVLDWEFGYAGCPYADAANMVRFGADDPGGYLDGFRAGFAGHLPAELAPGPDWLHLGRILDMFALSDLVTRPLGHPVADRAAGRIRAWVTGDVPDAP